MSPTGIDLNECLNNPCVGGKCMNTPGSFLCICPPGYELDETGLICQDINDCDLEENPCGNGICTNTPGGFQCTCPDGYKLKDDGKMCEDIDECASDDLNDCDEAGMTCRNMIGSYKCLCPPGYRRLGKSMTCVDKNECDESRVCTNGVCENLDGTFRCICNEGYIYDEENKLCLDTRQGLCYAAVHQRHCEVTSTTGLMFTKAECCCNRGKGWGDQCEECPHPGTADFMELCPHGPGFDPVGEDVDDCKVIPGLCSHGTCINTLGSFRCACDHGYEPSRSKQACLDVNECVRTPSPCSFDCRNTMGGYQCVCPAGYQLDRDGSSCVDLDECATKQHNCQYLCINTVGSFKCECPHGFVQEGQQCVDKNECMDTPGICGGRGICRNDPGGYQCGCSSGLMKTRGGCGDVDECSLGRGSCSFGCQNQYGGFACGCPNGAFRAGNGHCIGGRFGFQQRIPSFGGYGGGYGGFGGYPPQTDTVCYKCMPGGDTNRRQKRAAEEGGRFLYDDDQKMGYINMTVPVEVHVNSKDLKDGSLNLLELRPSLKQLRNNFKYFIVDGNQDKWFKLHRRNRFSSLHSSQRHIEENGDVPAGVYNMKLKGS